MKINFRKIASVLTSTVMLSSTIGFAAAANYPAPFVKSGNADVAVVWGSSAQASDLVAVTDITADLQAELASQTATTGSSQGSTSVSGGDYVKLERSSDKFNLGDTADEFYSSLDSEELSAVLADGVYQNDANDEFDFTQKIDLSSALALEHFQDNDFNDDKPVIGFNLDADDMILNYTLDFTPDAAEGGTNWADLETTELTLLGRSYYVVQAQNDSGKPKLTLLDSANSAIVADGESSTISVGDNDYEVSINYIGESDVILVIDGTTTNKLQEGDVFKIATDTYVAVKNILYSAKDTGVSKAEISIGSGKIVLQHGQEVKINNEDVSDIEEYNDASLVTTMYASNGDLDKLALTWTLGDDAWMTSGSDLVLPGFETVKVSMGAFNVPAKEMTSLENDGEDSIKISTTVEDGDVAFNLLYTDGLNITGIGKDSDDKLVTSATGSLSFNKSVDNWFVASWVNGDDAESYVLEVSDITDTDAAKNTTTVKSVATGSSMQKELDIGESEDFGRVRLTLSAASEIGDTATFAISSSSGAGSVNFTKLYTKDGMTIQLPYTVAGAITVGALNTSLPSYLVRFTEEDEDNTVTSGTAFNATIGLNADAEMQVSAVSVLDYETDDNSNEYVGYVASPLATKTVYSTDGDQDSLEIEYHGEEAYADVYVSETGAILSVDGSEVVSSGSVKKLGSVAVSDAEVASVSSKNLIVVGGSAVNTVAAELLGGAFSGAAFEQATSAGAGQFVIETFSRAGGKVATLVAGYNAADTSNAARYLTTQSVDTMVGKKYLGTSATSAELVTEAA